MVHMVSSVVQRASKGVSVSVSLELKFDKFIYTFNVRFTLSTSVGVSCTSKRVNIRRALHTYFFGNFTDS
jgi:hypothetical protein